MESSMIIKVKKTDYDFQLKLAKVEVHSFIEVACLKMQLDFNKRIDKLILKNK